MDEFDFYGSAPYKVLYQGDDPQEMVKRLAALKNSKKKRFDMLSGISMRLVFIEQLQNASRNINLHDNLLKGYEYQIDRLGAYLSTTCIEIAASKGHLGFHEWLKSKLESDVRLPNISKAIQDLTEASSNIEVEQRLLRWITTLHDTDYKDELGLSRAFKKFFEDLPDWLVNWLSNVYFIEDGDVLVSWFDPSKSIWLQKNNQERCQKIAGYLYTQVRNKHTHTVEYHPTMEDGGIVGMKFGDTSYAFNGFHKYGDWDKKRELSIGIKEGFTETDIIRFLIVYKLRQWLEFADDETLLTSYWQYTANRKLLYRFLHEMNVNQKKLHSWATHHLYQRDTTYVKELVITIAQKVQASLDEEIPQASSFELSNYLHSINIINKEIADFNAKAQVTDAGIVREAGTFLSQLTYHPQMRGVIRHMKTLESLVQHTLNIPMRFDKVPKHS